MWKMDDNVPVQHIKSNGFKRIVSNNVNAHRGS